MPKAHPGRSVKILVLGTSYDIHLPPVSGCRNFPVAKSHQKPKDVQIMQGSQAKSCWGRGEAESGRIKRSYSLTHHEGTVLARN